MRRRDFVITSGSAIFSTSLLGGIQQPAFGLEFELASVPKRNPRNIDSILIQFSKLKLKPYYVNYSNPVTIEITVQIGNYSEKTSKQISISDKQPITKDDLQLSLPIIIDNFNTSQSSVNGEISVTVTHKDTGSKTYNRSFTIADPQLVSDLTSYYPMEKGGGIILHDGAKSNTGELKGASWNGNAKIGSNSLSFDGSSYVELQNYPNLTGSFSISAWIKTNDNSQRGQRVLADDENNTGGYALSIGDGGTGTARFYMRNKNEDSLDANDAINSNTWHHVVAVHDSDQAKRYLYVDNVLEASKTDDTGSAGTDSGTASIGGETDAGESDSRFNGLIDDLRVYNKALTTSEVDLLYNLNENAGQLISESNIPSNENGGVARYKLNGDVTDLWGSYNGTDNTSDGYVTGVYSQAKAFDGTDDGIDIPSIPPFSEFTIALWAKTSNITDNDDGTMVQLRGNNHVYMVIDGDNSKAQFGGADQNINFTNLKWNTTENWNHYVFVWNGSEFIGYENAIEKSRSSHNSMDNEKSRSDSIGYNRSANTNYYSGKLDDVRIYERALTTNEIEKLFKKGSYQV